MSQIINTTDAAFDADVLKSELPVLVDFWAPWCGPCKAIAPTLEALAEEFDGVLKIVKVNVDDCGDSASKFGVRSIPSLKLFNGGEMIGEKVGALPKNQMISFLNEHDIAKN